MAAATAARHLRSKLEACVQLAIGLKAAADLARDRLQPRGGAGARLPVIDALDPVRRAGVSVQAVGAGGVRGVQQQPPTQPPSRRVGGERRTDAPAAAAAEVEGAEHPAAAAAWDSGEEGRRSDVEVDDEALMRSVFESIAKHNKVIGREELEAALQTEESRELAAALTDMMKTGGEAQESIDFDAFKKGVGQVVHAGQSTLQEWWLHLNLVDRASPLTANPYWALD